MNKKVSPFVERYRPTKFEDIILDKYNKNLFLNILENNTFPNLLLHGPPGIGKTTTIINLINKYQKMYNEESKTLVIHLNASDERGIDIIRNNIFNFVNSDNLFSEGTKFVILDEVDYMTRIAQQALKCLIQEYNKNVKYCLICNYISKIDYSLQYEFVKVRFNSLSHNDIFNYLNNIINKENISISKKTLDNIINYYDSDIRSMINFIQSNSYTKINILDNSILDHLYNINIQDNVNVFNKQLNIIEDKYNINKSLIIKNYLSYILNNYPELLCSGLITELEFIIHNLDNYDLCINYIFFSINEYTNKT
jgi:replication factor C subunit 3/5